jgi:hypothetical protein
MKLSRGKEMYAYREQAHQAADLVVISKVIWKYFDSNMELYRFAKGAGSRDVGFYWGVILGIKNTVDLVLGADSLLAKHITKEIAS